MTDVLAATMTEAQLEEAVITLAQTLGFAVVHFRPATTQRGWRTPITGDGVGWPDLVLVGHGRVLFRELKSMKGSLSDAQKAWGQRLAACGGNWSVWRPTDWVSGQIERTLRRET